MSRWQSIDELIEAEDLPDQGIYLTVDLPQTRLDRRRLRDSEIGRNRRSREKDGRFKKARKAS